MQTIRAPRAAPNPVIERRMVFERRSARVAVVVHLRSRSPSAVPPRRRRRRWEVTPSPPRFCPEVTGGDHMRPCFRRDAARWREQWRQQWRQHHR
eukprot:gene8728-biopygen13696